MTNVSLRESLPGWRPELGPKKDKLAEVLNNLHKRTDGLGKGVVSWFKGHALLLLGIFLWLIAATLFLCMPGIENATIQPYTHPMQDALVSWLIALGKACLHLVQRLFFPRWI